MSRARARQLRTTLESMGAELSANGDRLLVMAPTGAITLAMRLRMAEHREELMALVEESGPRKPVPRDPGAQFSRKQWRAVLDVHPMGRYSITGSRVVHGTVIVTIQVGRIFTYDLLAPADKYDAAELRDALQLAIDTPIH